MTSKLLGSLEKELDNFKQTNNVAGILQDTRKLKAELVALEKKLQNGQDIGQELKTSVGEWQDTIEEKQKQSNAGINKILKFLDTKIYEFRFEDVVSQFSNEVLADFKLSTKNQNLVNQVILNHVAREVYEQRNFENHGAKVGMNTCDGDNLLKGLESQFGYTLSPTYKSSLAQLSMIVESIINPKEPNLEPAFTWCADNSDKLAEIGSDVEFKLHELQFYLLYYGINKTLTIESPQSLDSADSEDLESSHGDDENDNSRFRAYLYAKKHFGALSSQGKLQNTEQYLSAARLLASTIVDSTDSRTTNSPYQKNNLRNMANYQATIDQLVSDYMKLNEISKDSPLFLVFMASIFALPSIVKFNAVHKQMRLSITNETIDFGNDNETAGKGEGLENELPLEFELPEFLVHKHPIFICPISRQEVTKRNPPLLLPCKHMLSKESLLRLVKTSNYSKRRAEIYGTFGTRTDFHELESEEEDKATGQEFDADTKTKSDFDFGAEESSENAVEIDFEESVTIKDYIQRIQKQYEMGNFDQNSERSIKLFRNFDGDFKCPYCPENAKINQTKRVFFGTV